MIGFREYLFFFFFQFQSLSEDLSSRINYFWGFLQGFILAKKTLKNQEDGRHYQNRRKTNKNMAKDKDPN